MKSSIIFALFILFSSLSAFAAEIETSATDNDDKMFHKWLIDRDGDTITADVSIKYEFVIDRPAADVWPYFKNLNLWQTDLHYSGIPGDEEGNTLNFIIKKGYYKKYEEGMGVSADFVRNFK